MKGLELARRYYFECVRPILEGKMPELSGRYAAGLIGYGSDVLGNDDEYSRDHEWGPRGQIFLPEDVHRKLARQIDDALTTFLPKTFLGFPTRFRFSELGSVPTDEESGHHHIAVTTAQRFLELTVGIKNFPETDIDWLWFSEQRLLELTQGEIFEDSLGEISELRESFAYFPENVWLFRLAFALESLGWEDDLIFMCGHRDDKISMHINASKTVERIMRLVFLLNKRYASLSPKWLEREFTKLPLIAPEIHDALLQILEGRDHHEKTDALNSVYEVVLAHLESLDLCNSYAREIRKTCSGIRLDIQRSAKDIWNKVEGDLLKLAINGLPSGAIDQWMGNEDVIMSPERMKAAMSIYRAKENERNQIGDLFI